MTNAQQLCFHLCKRMLARKISEGGFRSRDAIERVSTSDKYLEDRCKMAPSYLEMFKKYASFENKMVMDLGCGAGSISYYFAVNGPRKMYGVDSSGDLLEIAKSRYCSENLEFVKSTDKEIPLKTDSIDIVICIDTIEHLMEPEQIFRESYRVLRKDGYFIILFQPWLGVYGGHLEHIVPIPWCQVFFSTKTLTLVSKRIYDSDFYSPAHWDLDPTGKKKPNPFTHGDYSDNFLNKITLRQFRKDIKKAGFKIKGSKKIGFGGKKVTISKYLNFLGYVPLLEEIFTNQVLYVLEKGNK